MSTTTGKHRVEIFRTGHDTALAYGWTCTTDGCGEEKDGFRTARHAETDARQHGVITQN